MDGNISVRRAGEPKLGTKTEVKNVNSFANVERALTAERDRQIAELEAGGTIRQMTLTFNAATGEVRALRSKEESHDYRYFPDPDLPPLVVDPAWIEAERRRAARAAGREDSRGWSASFGLSAYDAQVLAGRRGSRRLLRSRGGGRGGAQGRGELGDDRGALGVERLRRFARARRGAGRARGLVKDGTVSLQAAKKVFAELAGAGGSPRATAERLGLVQVRDTSAARGMGH